MKTVKVKGNRGLIKAVFVILVALIVLGYFGYKLEDIMGKDAVKNNLQYAWDLVVTVWNKFLLKPATFVWDKIAVDLIWNNLQKLFNK